jgi:hypothetical protein
MAALTAFTAKLGQTKQPGQVRDDIADGRDDDDNDEDEKSGGGGGAESEAAEEGRAGKARRARPSAGYDGQVTEGDQLFGHEADDDGQAWFAGKLKVPPAHNPNGPLASQAAPRPVTGFKTRSGPRLDVHGGRSR